MGFVLDKQGNYLPVFGEATGGGGGTSDHAQLTNLSYVDSGHTGFMSSENFIPNGTTITVKSSDGDFTNLNDAINSLEGKWSNGKVSIVIDAGTFVHNGMIDIRNGDKFFIPMLDIQGSGINDTTLDYTANTTDTYDIKASTTTTMWIRNLTVKSNNHRGITATGGSIVFLQNISTDGCNIGIRSESNSNIILVNSVSIKNGITGILSKGGNIGCIGGTQTIFSSINTAFSVEGGGMLRLTNPSYSGTNVTNKTSQTVGTATDNGWITGISS